MNSSASDSLLMPRITTISGSPPVNPFVIAQPSTTLTTSIASTATAAAPAMPTMRSSARPNYSSMGVIMSGGGLPPSVESIKELLFDEKTIQINLRCLFAPRMPSYSAKFTKTKPKAQIIASPEPRFGTKDKLRTTVTASHNNNSTNVSESSSLHYLRSNEERMFSNSKMAAEMASLFEESSKLNPFGPPSTISMDYRQQVSTGSKVLPLQQNFEATMACRVNKVRSELQKKFTTLTGLPSWPSLSSDLLDKDDDFGTTFDLLKSLDKGNREQKLDQMVSKLNQLTLFNDIQEAQVHLDKPVIKEQQSSRKKKTHS